MIMNIGRRIVKELKGHSGSQIFLMENENGLFVRKIGDTGRNIERLVPLNNLGFSVPKIFNIEEDSYDMEYIHGLDMKTHLLTNTTDKLKSFLVNTLQKFNEPTEDYDFSLVYEKKLEWMKSENVFPFSKMEIIEKLPKILPRTCYHGDFTLENIIYSENGFFMIDPLQSEYESYIFDIAKLRQDLECRWFLRNDTNVRIGVKLHLIQDKLFELFPFANDDYLLILMLLRVYPYTKNNQKNRKFIMKEIERLWK